MSSIVFWLNPKQWQKVNNKNLRPCLPLRTRIRQSRLHTLCGPDIDPISSCLLILTWNRFRFADYFVLTPCRLLSRGSCSVITSCSGCRSCRGRKTCFAFRRPELLVKEPFERSRTGGMAWWWVGEWLLWVQCFLSGWWTRPQVDGGDGCAALSVVKTTGWYTLNVWIVLKLLFLKKAPTQYLTQ